jgi:6-phospho-beta-glucosidase
VEAALSGNLALAMMALVNDPLVTNLDSASAMLDEMLAANQKYLPQFNLP